MNEQSAAPESSDFKYGSRQHLGDNAGILDDFVTRLHWPDSGPLQTEIDQFFRRHEAVEFAKLAEQWQRREAIANFVQLVQDCYCHWDPGDCLRN